MSEPSSLADLAAFERVLSHTKLRVRGARAARGLIVGGAVIFTWGVVASATNQAFGAGHTLSLLALSLLPALWPVSADGAAKLLDRAHDEHERATTGVEFLRAPVSERTPFMAAHLRDLGARAGSWSAARAVPVRRPRELLLLSLPLLAWVALRIIPASEPAKPRASLTVEKQAPSLDADDLAAFRNELRSISRDQPRPEPGGDRLQTFNQLLERLATGEVSRSEGIRALLSLERNLLTESREQAVNEAEQARLNELADALARVSKLLSEALKARQLAVAAKELRAVTQQVSENANQKEQLKRALEQERARLRAEDARDARAEELDGLLKKPRPAQESASERSLFERRRRELDQLRREQAERQASSRRLDRLSRDLADASEAFAGNDSSEAQRQLEQAAQELERFAERERASQTAQQLAREASQLRELLQRKEPSRGADESQASAGGAGSSREQRQQRFVLRARGEDEQHTLSIRPGDSSERQPGQGAQGQQGQGEQGQGTQGKDGQDKQGEGAGGEQVQVLTPGSDGQGGQSLEILLPATRSVSQTGGAGSERGAPPLPSPTSLKATHSDSAVAGSPGKGPTRSQVILDAADRGFRTAPYQKVYADYRAHAESVIERDQVPQGHRFYVRRYFQLIRPRDE
jgi:hypothetical protein